MIVTIILSFLVFWIICGILNYGLYFAYLQKKYPELAERDYKIDRRDALIDSFGGAVSLFITLINKHHKYGFKFK